MKKAKNYQIKKKEEIEFWYVWMIDWVEYTCAWNDVL